MARPGKEGPAWNHVTATGTATATGRSWDRNRRRTRRNPFRHQAGTDGGRNPACEDEMERHLRVCATAKKIRRQRWLNMEKDQKKDEDDKGNKQHHHKQEQERTEEEEQEGIGAHSVAGRDRLQLERHSDQPAAQEEREPAQLSEAATLTSNRKTRRRT